MVVDLVPEVSRVREIRVLLRIDKALAVHDLDVTGGSIPANQEAGSGDGEDVVVSLDREVLLGPAPEVMILWNRQNAEGLCGPIRRARSRIRFHHGLIL